MIQRITIEGDMVFKVKNQRKIMKNFVAVKKYHLIKEKNMRNINDLTTNKGLSTQLKYYQSRVKWVLIIKRKNKNKMRLCSFSKRSLYYLIKSFSMDDLVKIDFDRDKRYSNEILWIFNYFHNGTKLYIKLKFLDNGFVKIISFHPTN
jgi:superfamily II RNA helicase